MGRGGRFLCAGLKPRFPEEFIFVQGYIIKTHGDINIKITYSGLVRAHLQARNPRESLECSPTCFVFF